MQKINKIQNSTNSTSQKEGKTAGKKINGKADLMYKYKEQVIASKKIIIINKKITSS